MNKKAKRGQVQLTGHQMDAKQISVHGQLEKKIKNMLFQS